MLCTRQSSSCHPHIGLHKPEVLDVQKLLESGFSGRVYALQSQYQGIHICSPISGVTFRGQERRCKDVDAESGLQLDVEPAKWRIVPVIFKEDFDRVFDLQLPGLISRKNRGIK